MEGGNLNERNPILKPIHFVKINKKVYGNKKIFCWATNLINLKA